MLTPTGESSAPSAYSTAAHAAVPAQRFQPKDAWSGPHTLQIWAIVLMSCYRIAGRVLDTVVAAFPSIAECRIHECKMIVMPKVWATNLQSTTRCLLICRHWHPACRILDLKMEVGYVNDGDMVTWLRNCLRRYGAELAPFIQMNLSHATHLNTS